MAQDFLQETWARHKRMRACPAHTQDEAYRDIERPNDEDGKMTSTSIIVDRNRCQRRDEKKGGQGARKLSVILFQRRRRPRRRCPCCKERAHTQRWVPSLLPHIRSHRLFSLYLLLWLYSYIHFFFFFCAQFGTTLTLQGKSRMCDRGWGAGRETKILFRLNLYAPLLLLDAMFAPVGWWYCIVVFFFFLFVCLLFFSKAGHYHQNNNNTQQRTRWGLKPIKILLMLMFWCASIIKVDFI